MFVPSASQVRSRSSDDQCTTGSASISHDDSHDGFSSNLVRCTQQQQQQNHAQTQTRIKPHASTTKDHSCGRTATTSPCGQWLVCGHPCSPTPNQDSYACATPSATHTVSKTNHSTKACCTAHCACSWSATTVEHACITPEGNDLLMIGTYHLRKSKLLQCCLRTPRHTPSHTQPPEQHPSTVAQHPITRHPDAHTYIHEKLKRGSNVLIGKPPITFEDGQHMLHHSRQHFFDGQLCRKGATTHRQRSR